MEAIGIRRLIPIRKDIKDKDTETDTGILDTKDQGHMVIAGRARLVLEDTEGNGMPTIRKTSRAKDAMATRHPEFMLYKWRRTTDSTCKPRTRTWNFRH